MATVEQLAQGTGGSAPTARRSSETNKCPTFSGRDTEWSEWSFIFESVAAMANLEPAMEGAFSGLAQKPFAELTPELKLSAKQEYYLLENTVEMVDSRPKRRKASRHRGMEAYQDRRHTQQCSWETCNLVGVSRGAANTFLDQLTEWERRIQKYGGESFETFSEGMKIAVLASHAPESIRRWEVSSGAPKHVRVFSVWPNLQQGWSESGVGTLQCKCDTDGCSRRWQRQRKGMLRVRTSRPRSERLQSIKVLSSSGQACRWRKVRWVSRLAFLWIGASSA